jgi:sec-independent protein translocase protein TatC
MPPGCSAGDMRAAASSTDAPSALATLPDAEVQREAIQSFLYPDPEELPDGASPPPPRRCGRARTHATRADATLNTTDVQMTIWDHLEELRDRAAVSAGAIGALVLGSFCFSKELVLVLERPVADQARARAARLRRGSGREEAGVAWHTRSAAHF